MIKRKILLAFFFALLIQSGNGQPALKTDFDNGVKFLQSQNYKKAMETFSGVLKKATEKELKKFCYIYRGFSYNGLGDYKNSIADLDKAIELDPEDLASYMDRGKTKAYSNDLDGSKKDFLFILARDSTGEQGQAALYYLAKIAYQQIKFDESIKYYDKIITLVPNDPELYFNRGAAKGMLMNNEGCITDYDKAIALKPDYMEAYANRGVAKINLLTTKGNIQPTKEQTMDGCADLKKVKQLGNNSVDDMIFVYCDKK
ncbi:MAG: tetratricopeptide repeat protein [Bacteroidota bacterium]